MSILNGFLGGKCFWGGISQVFPPCMNPCAKIHIHPSNLPQRNEREERHRESVEHKVSDCEYVQYILFLFIYFILYLFIYLFICSGSYVYMYVYLLYCSGSSFPSNEEPQLKDRLDALPIFNRIVHEHVLSDLTRARKFSNFDVSGAVRGRIACITELPEIFAWCKFSFAAMLISQK